MSRFHELLGLVLKLLMIGYIFKRASSLISFVYIPESKSFVQVLIYRCYCRFYLAILCYFFFFLPFTILSAYSPEKRQFFFVDFSFVLTLFLSPCMIFWGILYVTRYTPSRTRYISIPFNTPLFIYFLYFSWCSPTFYMVIFSLFFLITSLHPFFSLCFTFLYYNCVVRLHPHPIQVTTKKLQEEINICLRRCKHISFLCNPANKI